MESKKNRKKYAKRMRKYPTMAERVLRKALNKKCKHFKNQVLKCGYILDFYSERHQLAIEVDGPSHDTRKQKAYDKRRNARLATIGIITVRFTNEKVLNSTTEVINEIFRKAIKRYVSKNGRILSISTRERVEERYSPLFAPIKLSQSKGEQYQPSVEQSVGQLKVVAQPRPLNLPAIFPELWQKDPLEVP